MVAEIFGRAIGIHAGVHAGHRRGRWLRELRLPRSVLRLPELSASHFKHLNVVGLEPLIYSADARQGGWVEGECLRLSRVGNCESEEKRRKG